MNKIVSNFLIVGDKFMFKIFLRQPGFTYSAGRSCTKIKERIQKFKETSDSRYIYQNELDKACFPYNMDYKYFEDIARKAVIKYYVIKHLILLNIQNLMGINVDSLQWLINFLTKIRLQQK